MTATSRLDPALRRALTERAAAPELYARLMSLPPRERREAVLRDPRFATLGLAACLLTQARSKEPRAAAEHARLALGVLDHLGPERYRETLLADFRSRAWAVLATSRARREDLAAAEDALAQAWAALLFGSGDPFEFAEVLAATAVLRQRQWRSREAAGLLHRARGLYLIAGAPHAAAALDLPNPPGDGTAPA